MKLVVFPKKTKENGECRVYVQLTHKRKVTWIKTSICVNPEYFENGRINSKKDINSRLKNLSLSETIIPKCPLAIPPISVINLSAKFANPSPPVHV